MSKPNRSKFENPKPPKTAALRRVTPTAFSDKSIEVDEVNGIIKNVSLMTVGPALGHGFDLDQQSIEQIAKLVNAAPDGVKVRVRHPVKDVVDPDGSMSQKMIDDFGTMVGRVKNARVDGQQARGDVYLGAYAEDLPGLGNMKKFLINFAKADPTGFGMSVLMQFDPEIKTDPSGNPIGVLARPVALFGVDFVGQGAANPNGLLSAKDAAAAATAPPAAVAFPADLRGGILVAIAKAGPLHLAGLGARFNGRLEQIRADAEWLVNTGYATKTNGAYKPTPRGLTAIAMRSPLPE